MLISEITKEQWNEFIEILTDHYKKESNLFTEDLIRYWFIDYFREKDISKQLLKIEVPYIRENKTDIKLKENLPIQLKLKEDKNRSRADLYYSNNDEVIEFKFHRSTDYSKSCTGSDLGSLLNDFNRLSIIANNKKYSIYVCDQNMENYLIENHSENFPILNFNSQIQEFVPQEMYYNKNGFKDILKHAFNSFLYKEDYDKDPSKFDLTKFNYKVKLLYKNCISNNKSNDEQNMYFYVFEIENI